jgi:glucose/arabinose dehydrogenase
MHMLPRLTSLIAAGLIVLALAPVGAIGAPVAILRPFASGLDKPVFVTSARDGSGRLFVVEQTGRIRIVTATGKVLATPFLDISALVSKGGEQGLLGLAFDPSFKTNGRFYVDYTDVNGDTVVSRYHASTTNRNVAIYSSARRLLRIDQPYANHNGGMLAFGRDGYLYIGTGDGGSAGDPGNRAQSLNSLLGKLLRIDINGSTATRPYRIPTSNPYVGRTGLDAIWSRGLRNPWRFSFDRLTGDLWIGDVGQARYEEVDRAYASSGRGRGLNFGWRQMEGRHCYRPAVGCTTTGKTLPVAEYTHAEGCSITGGYVYRGAAVPSLYARYVFADFCSGAIWTIPRGGTAPMHKTLLLHTGLSIVSFGEDARGELYVVDHAGRIYRFAAS